MTPTQRLNLEQIELTFYALLSLRDHERLTPEDNLALHRVLRHVLMRWRELYLQHQDLHP